MDVTVNTTQRCSRECCARFLSGGDLVGTDQNGGKQTADLNFEKYEYKKDSQDDISGVREE